MTPISFPASIFPDNAVTRAERNYQNRSARKPHAWRRWTKRLILWLGVTIALILFGGLLVGSLTQRDPRPIVEALNPIVAIFTIFTLGYHFYAMFQTMALAANSITREKEAQTWEMLVLTGIDARKIVWGKWIATVQNQLPRYIYLAVFRVGLTGSIVIAYLSTFSYQRNYYRTDIVLPHPITVLAIGLFSAALPLANLGLTAACGVIGSAASKRSGLAIVRGFGNQIAMCVIPVIVVLYLVTRLPISAYSEANDRLFNIFGIGLFSMIDNGFIMLTTPFVTGVSYNLNDLNSAIYPVNFELILGGCVALVFFTILIRFALWRAEMNTVNALATPFRRKPQTVPNVDHPEPFSPT